MKIFQSISENIVKSGPPTKEDSHYESGTVWYDHQNGRIYYFFIIEDSSGRIGQWVYNENGAAKVFFNISYQ